MLLLQAWLGYCESQQPCLCSGSYHFISLDFNSTSTSRRSARRASTDYVNSATSGSHWTMNPRQPLCTRHELTTVTLHMRCHRRRPPAAKSDKFGRSSCQRHWQIWSRIEENINNTTSSTGWMSTTGLNTSLVWWCLHDRAPRYLADHLIPASDAAPRRLRLRSANANLSHCSLLPT